MSEYRCIHCGAKVDYEDIWGDEEGDCKFNGEQNCTYTWCDTHGCASEIINEDTNLNSNHWKQELRIAEMTEKDIKHSDYQWIICKQCDKTRDWKNVRF